MIWLYVILSILVLASLRLPIGKRVTDFSGKHTADIVKGIFIWMVFISHIQQYAKPIHPEYIDGLFSLTSSFWGQMIVVAFMFYSGYGVLINLNRGGYIESIPRRRCLTVLLNFDVAVVLFIVLDLIIGKCVTVSQGLLSLIAWDSVGNSNWYIFAILVMYLCSFVAAKLFGCTKKYLVGLTLMAASYLLIMCMFKPSWWYNTIFAYPAGAVYGYYKPKIDSFLQRQYSIKLFIVAVIFTGLYFMPDIFGIITNIRAVFLCVLLLMLTIKIQMKSRFLAWSGKNLFPIYIYQRMPMLTFSTVTFGGMSMLEYSSPLYISVCAAATILIAMLHKYFAIKL